MDGNKRAGTICLLTFLRCNGFYLDLNNEDIKTFTVETAKGNNDLDSIKLFIERYIKNIYKKISKVRNLARKKLVMSLEEATKRKEKINLEQIRPQVRKCYEEVKKERKTLIEELAKI